MPRSPFEKLNFEEGLALADKMRVERYETPPEFKAKQKLKAADKIAEALHWFTVGNCPYDAATARIIAKERLKEYRKY